MSRYLDGKGVDCTSAGGARYDRRGEGLTEWQDTKSELVAERRAGGFVPGMLGTGGEGDGEGEG